MQKNFPFALGMVRKKNFWHYQKKNNFSDGSKNKYSLRYLKTGSRCEKVVHGPNGWYGWALTLDHLDCFSHPSGGLHTGGAFQNLKLDPYFFSTEKGSLPPPKPLKLFFWKSTSSPPLHGFSKFEILKKWKNAKSVNMVRISKTKNENASEYDPE